MSNDMKKFITFLAAFMMMAAMSITSMQATDSGFLMQQDGGGHITTAPEGIL